MSAVDLGIVERKAIGGRIRVMRDLLGMTQAVLAAQCYVTQSNVSAWERGVWLPGRAQQHRLADVLHVSRSQLFREVAEAENRAVA